MPFWLFPYTYKPRQLCFFVLAHHGLSSQVLLYRQMKKTQFIRSALHNQTQTGLSIFDDRSGLMRGIVF
ncbi:MAG: hypothetical protein ABS92_13045 [Thiobacillus sp. SCN 63-374]|nr:MAG: hypothetical protein ABS92_13045 [Thiobacillus sp. SCN 63-374]